MRFASGVTDQFIYFVAVDLTDLKTRETGLTGFTVRRSRNGGTSVAFDTPTVNETDSVNMPGVYELLLDEDMTIDAGDETQEYCLHITQASMTPVTRTFELYRPKITAGETLTVETDGQGHADLKEWLGAAPNALIASRVDVSVGAMAANVLTAAAIAANAITAAKIAADAIGANQLATDAVEKIADFVWDELLTGATHNIATSAGRRLRDVSSTAISIDTAQAGASNSITLASGEPSTDDIFTSNLISIIGGTGVGQTRVIVEYDGTTKVAIVNRTWEVNPDATSEYAISAFATVLPVDHGTAQAGASGSITLEAGASATTDIFKGDLVFISTGLGAGQARFITAYDGTTKIALVSPDWVTTPDSTSVYQVFPKVSTDVASLGGSAQSLIDLQDFADAGYDPGTNKVQGVVLVDTTTVSTDVLARLPTALVGGRMDSSVGAMITDILTADALATDAAEEIADALLDRVAGIETGFTPRQALRLILAALVGKLSGAATTNILIRDVNDTKDRINATVDASGNRTAVTKDTT